MPESSKQEPAVAVLKAYDFVLWLLPKVETFPRSYRFSVGNRLVTAGLDLLLVLVRASYTSDKTALLQSASLETNTLRYLLRLAKDLKILSIDAHGFSVERVEEIGRMIGGWQKSVARRA
jgi:hypothetical protein